MLFVHRCRRRTEKLLDSSPLQIALCVLVVLDAAIVLSEILIDLQAMRSQCSLAPDISRTHVKRSVIKSAGTGLSLIETVETDYNLSHCYHNRAWVWDRLQESRAIAKVTARCALWMPWKVPG